jgi:hypothetical protein
VARPLDFRRISALGLCCLAVRGPCLAQIGFDTALSAPALVSRLTRDDPFARASGVWLRIRGVPDPALASAPAVAQTQRALAELKGRHFHLCVLLMNPPSAWAGGVRSLPGARLPLDLREADAKMARLGATYRGLVDAWEIDNEPDIGFLAENAETYLAYLKACYLGAHAAGAPAVLMAALAMPPGPYLERLLEDGLLSYTDGFNYHYYGYATDFSGVFRQFQAAVGASEPPGRSKQGTKELPVFLTEFGYGMLGDADAARSAEGRQRQARWFQDVAGQIRGLPIQAALAFCLYSDFEHGWNEFGLTAPSADSGESMTPALAALVGEDGAPGFRAARTWTVAAAAASPVVMDFVAGRDLTPVKSSQGYLLAGSALDPRAAGGALWIYNLSSTAVAGRLRVVGGTPEWPEQVNGSFLRLAPQARVEVPLRFPGAGKGAAPTRLSAAFEPADPGVSGAQFSTSLYRVPLATAREPSTRLEPGTGMNSRQREALRRLPRDSEEPGWHETGRWLATEGVDVTAEGEGWRIKIERLPATSLRPAVAEMPLPGLGRIAPTDLLSLELRCLAAGALPARYAGFSTAAGGLTQVQLRAANGNLFEVWPRRELRADWQAYREPASAFTPSFFGRAAVPWRFEENSPVALVLTFWPRALPTEVGVRGVELLRPSP